MTRLGQASQSPARTGRACLVPRRATTWCCASSGCSLSPDRPTALAQMRRVLRPGGRLGVSVYGPIEHNPAAFALARALYRHLGPAASRTQRAEHALADPVLLRTLAADAGFTRIEVVTETRAVRRRVIWRNNHARDERLRRIIDRRMLHDRAPDPGRAAAHTAATMFAEAGGAGQAVMVRVWCPAVVGIVTSVPRLVWRTW